MRRQAVLVPHRGVCICEPFFGSAVPVCVAQDFTAPGPARCPNFLNLCVRLTFPWALLTATVALRTGRVQRINSASGKIFQATALSMVTRRSQANVRSCEQPWMPFLARALFFTTQCICRRGSNLSCRHGHVAGFAALCLLLRFNSREFATANNANFSPPSADSAAVCVQTCRNRFLFLVRGSAEKRSGLAIAAPSQGVRSCEPFLRGPREAMTGSIVARIPGLDVIEIYSCALAHHFS